MGLWNRLLGVESAEKKESHLLLSELMASYQEETRLARQIRAHAELSPHQAGKQNLHAVAVQLDRVAQRLAERIAALGGEAQPGIGPTKGGKNHWARAYQDLEDSQTLERRYMEFVLAWNQDLPEVAEFFRTLEQERGYINALLRNIALRADPHALD